MDGDRLHELWRRGQHGWPARFPVVQVPNAPLLVAIAAWIVAKIATSGTLHDVSRALFVAALCWWAVLEVVDGANWLRRALGVGVLAVQALAIAQALS